MILEFGYDLIQAKAFVRLIMCRSHHTTHQTIYFMYKFTRIELVWHLH